MGTVPTGRDRLLHGQWIAFPTRVQSNHHAFAANLAKPDMVFDVRAITRDRGIVAQAA